MNRAGWLALAFLAAVGACVGAVLGIHGARHPGIPSRTAETSAVDPPEEKLESPLADATPPAPFVRSAPEFHPPMAPTPINVTVDPLIEGSDIVDPEIRTFAELESATKPNEPVAVDLGTTDGFTGTRVRLVLDPSTKTATVLVDDFFDAGPTTIAWSEVGGTVLISSWKLDESTLIDVDLTGRRSDPAGESNRFASRSIHVCTRMPAGEPFVDIHVVLDPNIVVPERKEKNVYTQVDWKAHGTGLVTVWIGNGNGHSHSGAQVMLDTITHTARVRASNGYDFSGSTRFWKSLTGEVRLSSWDLAPAMTKFSIDLNGKLGSTNMHLQRVSVLDEVRPGRMGR